MARACRVPVQPCGQVAVGAQCGQWATRRAGGPLVLPEGRLRSRCLGVIRVRGGGVRYSSLGMVQPYTMGGLGCALENIAASRNMVWTTMVLQAQDSARRNMNKQGDDNCSFVNMVCLCSPCTKCVSSPCARQRKGVKPIPSMVLTRVSINKTDTRVGPRCLPTHLV